MFENNFNKMLGKSIIIEVNNNTMKIFKYLIKTYSKKDSRYHFSYDHPFLVIAHIIQTQRS